MDTTRAVAESGFLNAEVASSDLRTTIGARRSPGQMVCAQPWEDKNVLISSGCCASSILRCATLFGWEPQLSPTGWEPQLTDGRTDHGVQRDGRTDGRTYGTTGSGRTVGRRQTGGRTTECRETGGRTGGRTDMDHASCPHLAAPINCNFDDVREVRLQFATEVPHHVLGDVVRDLS